MRIGLLIAISAAAACSQESSLFLRKTWPEDQAAVVIVARQNGEVIESFVVQPGQNLLRDLPSVDDPVIVHARVYRELAEREPLADCVIGSAGDPLGAPAFAWRSAAARLGLGSSAIVLEPDPSPEVFDLRVSGCAKKPASCDVILSFIETEPALYGLRDVAAIYPDTAMAGGAGLVMRIDGETGTVLGDGSFTGLADAIVRHGLNAVFATTDGKVIVIDRLGNTLSSTTVSPAITDGATGADGTTLLIAQNGAIYEVGERQLTRFPSPAYPILSFDAPRISVARRDRVLIAGPDGRLYFWNGVEWTRELPATESFDAVAIDDRTMFVVPTDDQTLIRDDGGSWRSIGPVFLTTHAAAAVALGDGRFFAVGQSGTVVYWNGEQACKPGSSTALNIEDADFYPGSNVGYLVGENETANTPPLVVRAEVF